MDRLDHLVTTHVAERLLEPSRLSDLLTSLSGKRCANDISVRDRLRTLQGEVAQADEKLRRLYKMVEDGLTDMDDVLAERVASLKSERELAKAALQRLQAQTRPEISLKVDDIQRFGAFMSEKITTGEPSFRRAYLRSIIEGIEVDDNVIRIHGSRTSLEQAVIAKEQIGNGVRGFIRKWRAQGDSNPCFRRERATS